MLNSKKLRFIVPSVQILLLISVAVWHNYASRKFDIDTPNVDPSLSIVYGQYPLVIVAKLNYPLALFWIPLFNMMDRFSTSGPSIVVAVVLDLFVLSSLALFWYFFIFEVQLRVSGKSLIRFSNVILEVFKEIVLCFAGIGAIVCAYWASRAAFSSVKQFFSYRPYLYPVSVIELAIGGLFLLAWALVLIGMAVQDIKIVFLDT